MPTRLGRPLLAVLAVLVCGLVAVPVAQAESDSALLLRLAKDYAKDQKINACDYTQDELKRLKAGITNDADQYAPDLREELSAAIDRRAAGGCGTKKGGQASPGTSAPGSNGPSQPAAPAQPKSTPGVPQAPPAPSVQPTASPAVSNNAIAQAAGGDDGNGNTPAALVALAVLAGIGALAGASIGAARWWAFEPAWTVRLRHATAEAGWRASSAWAEFTDFVRFGR